MTWEISCIGYIGEWQTDCGEAVYVDSWSEQYRHELFALGLSDMVCTFVCDCCSCHASGYNKGGDLSSPKEIHCGEVA